MADTTLSLGVDSSAVRRASGDLDRLSTAGKRTETATKSLSREFVGLRNALGVVAASVAVRQIVQTADAYKSLGARLQLVTRSSQEYATAQAALFRMAQDTRVGLEQTTDLFASLARSTESLGVSQSDLLGVTQTINQALVVSGTSASSAAAALVQLGQGFAAGALRGDELNSVMEQAPRLAKAIADGMGVSVGKLRELGAEGKITGEAVFTALQKSASQINAEFNRMPLTVDQAATQAGNSLMKLIGVMDDASGSTKGLASVISDAAMWMGELAEQIEKAKRGEEDVDLLARAFMRTTEAVKILGAYIRFTFEYFGNQIGAVIARIELLAEATENAKKRAGAFDLFGTGNFFDELSKAKPKFTAISDAVNEDVERAVRQFHRSMDEALRSYRLTGERLNSQTDPRSLTFGQAPTTTVTAPSPDKKPKKDPYADAVKSLREQIALVGQLTELEQTNAKIALGNYGKLSAAQQERLRGLAADLDGRKASEAARQDVAKLFEDNDLTRAAKFQVTLEALDEAFFSGAKSAKEYDAALQELTKATSTGDAAASDFLDSQKRLAELLGATPTAALEAQRKDMQLLADAFERGQISVEEFAEAANARLGNVAEELKPQLDAMSVFAEQAGRNIQDSLGDTIKRTLKGDFDSIGKMWGDLLIDMVAQGMAINIGKSLFGDFGKTGNFGGLFGGIFSSFFGHKDGLDYVPYDNYPAMLHKGERVLTAQEAKSGSGPVINLTYNVAPGVTRGDVLQAMQMTREQTKADVLESMRRAGAFA